MYGWGRLLFREFKLFFHGDSEQRLLLLTSWSLWSRGIYFAPTRIYSSIPLSPLTPQEQTHLEFSFDTHEKINQAFFPCLIISSTQPSFSSKHLDLLPMLGFCVFFLRFCTQVILKYATFQTITLPVPLRYLQASHRTFNQLGPLTGVHSG